MALVYPKGGLEALLESIRRHLLAEALLAEAEMSRIGGIGGGTPLGGPRGKAKAAPAGTETGRPPAPWSPPSLAEEPDGIVNRGLALRVLAMNEAMIGGQCRVAIRVTGGGRVVIDAVPNVGLGGRVVGLTHTTAEKLTVQTEPVPVPEEAWGKEVWAIELLYAGEPFFRIRYSVDVPPEAAGVFYRFGANVSI